MGTLDLVLLALWSFSVAVAGGIAGLVLGNLRLPVVVGFASSPAAGAGSNVVISGIAAFAAAIAHWRAGRLNWPLLAWLAPTSLAGGIVGGLISGALPSRLLLGVIALVVLYGAIEIARGPARPEAAELRSRGRAIANAALVGFGIGVLGGTVGLILGTLRLPALMRWVGTSAKDAVGTNSAAGVVVAIGGLIGHLPSGIDWALVAVGGAASVPGALIGARLVGRLSERQLLRAIAAVCVVAGLAMLAVAIAG
ncbi:MAG TPA: sulfite exporter TauE/SafE family protein [Solirubrobacterales bacterium]